MKNQYFGDINDYRKYGLLRGLTGGLGVLGVSGLSGLSLMVAWMLTPDDGRSDGRFTTYLDKPEQWSTFDPELYEQLRRWIKDGRPRHVAHIEGSDLLPNAAFFSEIVPDDAGGRGRWTDRLLEASRGHDLVFLDPDNGLEVKSKPYGARDSSKYVYRREIVRLFEAGHSLLIYQHFPRVTRDVFVTDTAGMLMDELGINRITTFRTSNVLFVLAAQPQHRDVFETASRSVADSWAGQIGVHQLRT